MDAMTFEGKQIDNLVVRIHRTRAGMSADAARLVKKKINTLLTQQPFVNMLFAAAPSQSEFLDCLAQENGIDWSRVRAFHMDEYLGLSSDAEQRFGKFLKSSIFDRVRFHIVHYMCEDSSSIDAECERYADLLEHFPPDIVCLGIGENAHLAFNDPHVADFNDPVLVKVVDLDESCRMQQVNDGCFSTIEEVPAYAVTLTIPALLRAQHIFCIVPGANKADAVYHTLNSEVDERYPSTILRTHPDSILFLDEQSAARIR